MGCKGMTSRDLYQVVYDNSDKSEVEVAELLGFGDVASVATRRMQIEEYLKENLWDLDSFMAFIDRLSLPSGRSMMKGLIRASRDAVSSGFKMVPEEEQKRRHDVCETSCEFYREIDDRCAKCGCFTSFKSRLEAWHCPIGKW